MAQITSSGGYHADGSPMSAEEVKQAFAQNAVFDNKVASPIGTVNNPSKPPVTRPSSVSRQEGADADITDITSANGAIKQRRTALKDTNWVSQTFALTSAFATVLTDSPKRYYDASEFKFYDTTPGGYRAINPPPQFTRHADIKRRNRNSGSRAMGRYFSEAHDDSAQVIHCRLGVAEMNSLTGFLARAYEPVAGKLARTGEGQSFLSAATDLVTGILLLPTVPFIQGWAGAKSLLSDAPNNKFYYSKPAMALYYNAVNMMLIKLAVDMKLIGGGKPTADQAAPQSTEGAVPEKETYNGAFKVESELSEDDRLLLNGMFPDIFDTEFGFDIRAMSTRYQRMANADYERQGAVAAAQTDANAYKTAIVEHMLNTPVEDDRNYVALGPYLEAYINTAMASGGKGSGNVTTTAIDKLADTGDEVKDRIRASYASNNDERADYGSWWSSAWEFFKGEFYEGSQWVNIRVESTGTSSSSFNNSTEESGLATSINSASASAQATKFNFAGGNIGDDMFTDFAEATLGAVSGVVSSVGKSIGAGAIGAMLGGGKLDIPKYWTDSSATLPGGSYSVKLRTPYGNKVSIFKDIYIPQCMIMCMGLPKAAGPSAYTSPFVMEIFDPGRWQSALAIMENLNIERGTGNLGWSKDGYPLGVDITFDIVDLTTIMAMPITGQSFSFNDRSPYIDYMAAMANKNPLDQITVSGRFNAKRKVVTANLYSTFSASNLASITLDNPLGRLAKSFGRVVSL